MQAAIIRNSIQRISGRIFPARLLKRKRAAENACQRFPISILELAEAAYDFILSEYGKLVNPNCRRGIQARFAPPLDGEVELAKSRVRSDGRSDEVVISRVEQHHGRTQFAAWTW